MNTNGQQSAHSDPSQPNNMKVVFGVFDFRGREAFLGEGLGGMKGMCIMPGNKSPLPIVPGFNAVSFPVYENTTAIYARAITSTDYLNDVLRGLRDQLELVKKTGVNTKFPPMASAMRMITVLDFHWDINRGVPNLRSTYGAGLRGPDGRPSDGAMVYGNHQEDPITKAGFSLVEMDIHPNHRYTFARPNRNPKLIKLVITQIESQLDRIVEAGLGQQSRANES